MVADAARIRSLRTEDVEPLAIALAESFLRQDMVLWVFPEPRRRDEVLVAMFRSRLSAALVDAETVADVADDLSGGAIWKSPQVPLDDNPPPDARPEVVEAFRAIYAARPEAPFWYLHGIGARVEHRGIGSALMTVGLRRCDATGVPSALWTGDERNLAFYRKHGYRELQRFDFQGASAWWMWRDPPRGAATAGR